MKEVKKVSGWEGIKGVNIGKSSEGQRGSRTINSVWESPCKWESSMGKQMFTSCELSKEIFLPFHFLLSSSDM